MVHVAGDIETALARFHPLVAGGSERLIRTVFALFGQEELIEPKLFESAGGLFVVRRSQFAEHGGRRAGGDDQLLWGNDLVAVLKIRLAPAAEKILLSLVNLSDLGIETPQAPVERQAQCDIARLLIPIESREIEVRPCGQFHRL